MAIYLFLVKCAASRHISLKNMQFYFMHDPKRDDKVLALHSGLVEGCGNESEIIAIKYCFSYVEIGGEIS